MEIVSTREKVMSMEGVSAVAPGRNNAAIVVWRLHVVASIIVKRSLATINGVTSTASGFFWRNIVWRGGLLPIHVVASIIAR